MEKPSKLQMMKESNFRFSMVTENKNGLKVLYMKEIMLKVLLKGWVRCFISMEMFTKAHSRMGWPMESVSTHRTMARSMRANGLMISHSVKVNKYS